MGQAIITANHGAGQYTVSVQYDKTRLASQISDFELRIEACDSKITELQAEKATLTDSKTALLDELNAKITALTAAQATGDQAVIEAAAKALHDINQAMLALNDELRRFDSHIGLFELNRTAAQQRLAILQALHDTARTEQIWSADFNEEYTAGTEVGLVWPASDPDKKPIIYPGGVGGGDVAWTPARGAIQKEAANTPAGAFFNRAVMPLVQKSLQTYRIGTASNVTDTDMTVTLDAVTSRYGGVNINIEGVLSGVPVQYMECDGAAFEDGDKVLVRFWGLDQTSAQVIGFEHDPKPCDIIIAITAQMLSSPISVTSVIVDNSVWYDHPRHAALSHWTLFDRSGVITFSDTHVCDLSATPLESGHITTETSIGTSAAETGQEEVIGYTETPVYNDQGQIAYWTLDTWHLLHTKTNVTDYACSQTVTFEFADKYAPIQHTYSATGQRTATYTKETVSDAAQGGIVSQVHGFTATGSLTGEYLYNIGIAEITTETGGTLRKLEITDRKDISTVTESKSQSNPDYVETSSTRQVWERKRQYNKDGTVYADTGWVQLNETITTGGTAGLIWTMLPVIDHAWGMYIIGFDYTYPMQAGAQNATVRSRVHPGITITML